MGHSSLQTTSLKQRFSKVSVDSFASPLRAGMNVAEFLKGLPQILAAENLIQAAAAISRAAMTKKEVIIAMGAHVIKVGLSPVLTTWMDQGIITALALNGAGVIHDVEIALQGKTSEDVGPALDHGMFGVAEDTAAFIHEALAAGVAEGKGYGQAVAEQLSAQNPPYADFSLLCQAWRRGVPVSVHVALGTDIIHMHASADGADIGKASLRDFHQLTRHVANLEGGIFCNIGSAVMLPEVFLKALNLARNQGHKVNVFTALDMDFIKHYRPSVNVVDRPVRLGGQGFQFIGHHELNLPLLTVAVLEALADSSLGS